MSGVGVVDQIALLMAHCLIEPFWIKAAPAAPLARRQRRAQRWGRPPGARRAIATGHADPGGSRQAARWCAYPSPSLPIVQLAASAARSLPAVASHAIGFAEPRPRAHSHGSWRLRGERSRLDLSRPGWAARTRKFVSLQGRQGKMRQVSSVLVLALAVISAKGTPGPGG